MHIPTLLPLETFRREVFPINPWHFWGFSNATVPVSSSCNTLINKYRWQMADQAGRQAFEQAILAAEERIFDVLGFWPAPKYTVKDLHFPHYMNRQVDIVGYAGSDGRWQAMYAEEMYIQSCGVQTRTLIEADVTVTRSDNDSDGLKEQFTLSVATTVTDASQIAVYFSSADRFDGSDVSEDWRVQPINVSISGGTATITGPAWIIGKPVLYEGMSTTALDPGVDDQFVSTLDVYRLYINQEGTTTDTAQAVLTWETIPYPYWAGGDDPTNPSDDPAAVGDKIGRVALRDKEQGLFAPAEALYNSTDGYWYAPDTIRYRPPDRVRLRLFAGYPLKDGNMSPVMARIVARLAAAEMSHRVCACKDAQREFERWQRDLSRTTGPDQWGAINTEDLINPFGSNLGHVDAWKQAKMFRRLNGIPTGAF